MRIKQINNYLIFSTMAFTDNSNEGEARVIVYGPILAKIVSVLRTIGWVVTAGYGFKESLIHIPNNGSNYYLHPDQIQSALIELDEYEQDMPFTISQSDIQKIITNIVINKPRPAKKGKPFLLNEDSRAALKQEGLHINVESEKTTFWISDHVIRSLPKENIYFICRVSTGRWGVDLSGSDSFMKLLKDCRDKEIIALICFDYSAVGFRNGQHPTSYKMYSRNIPVWFFRIYNQMDGCKIEISDEDERFNARILEEALQNSR